MRFFVVSDIHGDCYWAGKAIEAFRREDADRMILLGDILYHGPRNDLPENYDPKKVIGMLNGIADKIIAVRGNCDTEVDQMVLKFPIMADYIYLVSGDTVFFITHGHHYGPDNVPAGLTEGTVLLSGHTHVVTDYVKDGIRFLNPGSPSIPKQDTKPSYIIIEDGDVKVKRFGELINEREIG